MLRYGLERPVITPKRGNWSFSVLLGWRLIFQDDYEMGSRETPHCSDANTTLGQDKAASVQILSFKKVSNIKN